MKRTISITVIQFLLVILLVLSLFGASIVFSDVLQREAQSGSESVKVGDTAATEH